MTQCHINWDSFKNNITKGFSCLQQQEEFVDMTLAADGHFVKVHKSLMALASPYIKSIILSAPCQHPILFLTNISHNILYYILEYVYTGEVLVPMDKIEAFIVAAKALHITGVHNLVPTMYRTYTSQQSESTEEEKQRHKTSNDEMFCNNDKNPDEILGLKDNYVKSDSYNLYPHNTPQAHLNKKYIQATSSQNVDSLTNNNVLPAKIQIPDLDSPVEKISSQNCIDFEQLIEDNTTHISNIENNAGKHPISDRKTYAARKKKLNNGGEKRIVTNNSFNIVNIVEQNDDDEGECGNLKDEYDNMEVESDANIQDWNVNYKLDCTTMRAEESTSNKNYSINVEMPTPNTGPPKITICSGVIENNPPVHNLETDVTCDMHDANKNNLPKITIESGTLANESKVTVTKSCDESTTLTKNDTSPLYTFSSKGSLQMIMNRFIYSVHHQAKRGKRLRWRCIDYRHKQCPAYVDTLGEVIISRKNAHKHSFHDDKIVQRGSSKPVFESLGELFKSLETIK